MARAYNSGVDGLRDRIRPPVVQALRRTIEGRREAERVADEVCEAVDEAPDGAEPRLRLRVAAALEQRARGAAGEEFDKDWAGSLLLAALKALRTSQPGGHRLLVRLYDRPEGAAPLTPEQLAQRLSLPPTEVARSLDEGRFELKSLFLREIAATVDDPALVADEVDRLMPYARAAFATA